MTSEKSLEVIAEQMGSSAGDVLREDELNFMDVPLNFYVFTGSSENLASTFQRKIFYLAMEESDFQMLESQIGLEKISDNLVSDHQRDYWSSRVWNHATHAIRRPEDASKKISCSNFYQ